MKSASTELEREAPNRNRNAGGFMRVLSVHCTARRTRRRQTAKLKKYVAEVYTLEIVRVRRHASALARVDERFANQKK